MCWGWWVRVWCCTFFQGECGIRDWSVTGVQTCALPISLQDHQQGAPRLGVEEVLEDAEAGEVLFQLRGGSRVVDTVGLRRVKIGQFDPGTRTHEKLFRKLFHTGSILH